MSMSGSEPANVVLSAATIDAIAAQVVARQPAPKRDYLAIFLPFVGVLLGAIVSGLATYMATSEIEYEKQRSQLQLSAYSDFAKGQAAWLRTQDPDTKSTPQQIESAALQIRDASFRIVLFSPAELVDRLAAFYRETSRPPCANTSNDLAVYQDMRQQVLGKKAGFLSAGTIAMVLFGCERKG